MTVTSRRVGAVVLTYNSTGDLPGCLAGLLAQKGVDLRVIVVDNASRPELRAEMEADFRSALPEGRVLSADTASADEMAVLPGVFLRNDRNAGYSAGNNIGARLAVALGCEAVLVINPDVRIENPDYTAYLFDVLGTQPRAGLAASRVRSLAGKNENPMVEPGFFEELLWPLQMLRAGLRLGRKVAASEHYDSVEKVSGSCFLISRATLEAIGYFDEEVFLYCEESILSAQLKIRGLKVAYCGELEVLHAHDTTKKGDSYERYAAWSRSRAYFHRTYTGHGPFARALLAGSRAMTLGLIRGRTVLCKLRSGINRNAGFPR